MVDGPGSLGETPVRRLGLEPEPGERGAVGRGGPRDLVAFDHPNLFDEWLWERKKEVQRKDHVDRFFLLGAPSNLSDLISPLFLVF